MISMSGLIRFENKDLEILTHNFSNKNFICRAQFCKLYRGNIPLGWKGLESREVTIKVWTDEPFVVPPASSQRSWEKNVENFKDEIMILDHHGTILSPYLPKPLGFCREYIVQWLGIVYDLDSLCVLETLFEKESFRWHDRIKVAFGLAKILEFFHGYQPTPYVFRDLSTAHIMITKDHNPVLFNFFGVFGGLIGEKFQGNDIVGRRALGSLRYLDFSIVHTGIWTTDMDVYSFGMILCELIRKRKISSLGESKKVPFESVGILRQVYRDRNSSKRSSVAPLSKFSLVDQTFEVETGFHIEDTGTISVLAMQCVSPSDEERPKAKEVVQKLNKMHIVKRASCFGQQASCSV